MIPSETQIRDGLSLKIDTSESGITCCWIEIDGVGGRAWSGVLPTAARRMAAALLEYADAEETTCVSSFPLARAAE